MSAEAIAGLVAVAVLVVSVVAGYVAIKRAPHACDDLAPDESTTCELLQEHPGPHADSRGRMWW